jgi:hypothetical protein
MNSVFLLKDLMWLWILHLLYPLDNFSGLLIISKIIEYSFHWFFKFPDRIYSKVTAYELILMNMIIPNTNSNLIQYIKQNSYIILQHGNLRRVSSLRCLQLIRIQPNSRIQNNRIKHRPYRLSRLNWNRR